MPSFHSFDTRRLPVRLSHAPMMLKAAASSLHRHEAENVEIPHASGQAGAGTTLCRLSRMIIKGFFPLNTIIKIYTDEKTHSSTTYTYSDEVKAEYIRCRREGVEIAIKIIERHEVDRPSDSDYKLLQRLDEILSRGEGKGKGREVVEDTPSTL